MSQYNQSPLSLEAVSDLLLSLQATLKFSRLYPMQHPLLIGAVNRLKENINNFFSQYKVLRLRLKRQNMYAGGRWLNKGDEVLEGLSMSIYRLGIRELCFYQGVTDEELLKFISIINSDPGMVMERGGIESIWEDNQISGIKVNETLNREVFQVGPFTGKSREAAPDISRLGEVVLLADFFSGQEKNLPREGYKLLGELMNNPQNFSDMMQALARSDYGEQDKEGAADNVFMQDYIGRAFSKLLSLVEQQPLEQRKTFYRQLAHTVQSLPPEIKDKLLQQLTNAVPENSSSANLLGEMSEQELAAALADRKKGGVGEESLANIIAKLPVSAQVKKGLLAHLKIEHHFIIPEEQPAVSEQQVALSPQEITEIQYEVPSDISSVLAELSSYSDAELKEIEKLQQVTERNNIDETLLPILSEILNLETGEEKYRKIVQLMQKKTLSFLDKNSFSWALRYYKALRDKLQDPSQPAFAKPPLQGACELLGAGEIIQKLIESLRAVDKDDAAHALISAYLNMLPAASVPFLIEVLAAEDSLAVRRLLCQVLSEAGKQNMEFLWEKLEDSDWHLVRNVVLILGMINDERSFEPMSRLLLHENTRVRMEVIKSLGLSGSPRVFDWLVTGLEDKNIQIKQQAIEWLGNLQDKRAIPIFLGLLKKFDPFGRQGALKKEAINALGVLRAQEAVPFLEKLAKGKWVGFIGSKKALIPEAREALEQIKGGKKHE